MNCFEHRQILLNCLSFAGGSQDHAGRRAVVHGPGDTVRIRPHAVGARHGAWQQELGPAPAVRLRKRDASRRQKYGKEKLHPKTKTFQCPSKESSWFSAGPSLFWTSETPDYQNYPNHRQVEDKEGTQEGWCSFLAHQPSSRTTGFEEKSPPPKHPVVHLRQRPAPSQDRRQELSCSAAGMLRQGRVNVAPRSSQRGSGACLSVPGLTHSSRQPPEEPASSREAEWSPVLRSARSETQESSTMESLFLFALI